MALLRLVPFVEWIFCIAPRHVHQQVLIRAHLVLTERILDIGRVPVQHRHLRVRMLAPPSSSYSIHHSTRLWLLIVGITAGLAQLLELLLRLLLVSRIDSGRLTPVARVDSDSVLARSDSIIIIFPCTAGHAVDVHIVAVIVHVPL